MLTFWVAHLSLVDTGAVLGRFPADTFPADLSDAWEVLGRLDFWTNECVPKPSRFHLEKNIKTVKICKTIQSNSDLIPKSHNLF